LHNHKATRIIKETYKIKRKII